MTVAFPVSGVETELWVPPVVAFVVSFFTSMVGISGAFLLLPFQMSVLGFTTPAVSATNLVFNLTGIPSGVWGYVRERRMLWPLTVLIAMGALPGVIVGGYVRLRWLPDPAPFKVFVGCVLLYVGARLAMGIRGERCATPAAQGPLEVTITAFNWCRLAYTFEGREHSCSSLALVAFAGAVGVVGGVYGIGGGSIVAPFLVAVFGFPVHTIAGAALAATFLTSAVGVLFYQFVGPLIGGGGVSVTPDWALGALFGAGGILGMYAGARMQRRWPARWLKLMLTLVLLWVAGRYLVGACLTGG